MKTIYKKLVFLIAFLLSTSVISMACEINFKVEGQEKAKYNIGEVVVLKITVEFTHNACPVALKETKIQANGMEILGATEWKNVSGNIWERKIKVKITSNKEGKAIISAHRSCEKDGGTGTMTLIAIPTKK